MGVVLGITAQSTRAASVITPVFGGGTGTSTISSGGIPYGNTTARMNVLPIGTSSYVLQSTGSAPNWVTISSLGLQPAGNYITALTGDITASGPGSVAATLATVNSNVGSFTNASITVNAKGLITAASSGTGGSGNSAWLFGSGLIYNATSTDSVLVGTSTPTTAKFFIQGSGSQLPLVVASSTGTTLFKIDTFGTTTIANLSVALPVRSTSGGALFNGAIDLSSSDASGILAAARFPALTGDITTSAGALGTTLATVNSNVGTFGSTALIPQFTVNGKGLITAASNLTPALPASAITSGVLTVAVGGTGTNTLASLTVGTGLSISGGQNVLVGTGTVISLGTNVVTTLATGTSGTIFNGSIGSNTLTLNLPFASGVNTGQLQAADWLTFNNKLSGSLTSGQVVFASGASTTVGSSLFTFATATGLNLTATSTQATTTITNLTVSGSSTHTGTTTLATTTVTQLTVSSLTSGNCVQAGAGGLLTTVAAACGSGGSGNSAWTIGSGLIYNATSTDLVGIGTITPTTTLYVQGKGGTNPFTIASSTGTALFTANQAGQILGGDGAASLPTYSFSNYTSSGIYAQGGGIIDFASNSTLIFQIHNTLGLYMQASMPIQLDSTLNTVASLALRFTGDGDTGLFNPTANNLAFATNGIERFRTDAVGNFLFATTTNANNFAQFSISPSWNIASGTSSSTLAILPTISSNASISPVSNYYTQQTLPLVKLLNSTTTITNFYNQYSGLTFSTGTITNLYGQYIAAPTGNGTITNKYAFVTEVNSGNIGLSTTTPAAKLAVVGTAGNNTPLIVASSTGTTMFSIGANASATIASLTASNCDVKSTTGGLLFCGIDATGAGSATASGTAGTIQYSNGSGGFDADDVLKYTIAQKELSLTSSTTTFSMYSPQGTQLINFSTDADNLSVDFFAQTPNGSNGFNLHTQTNQAFLELDDANLKKIYLDTSVDSYIFNNGNFGVGTITPTSKLFVQGSGGTNPFVIASSTGVAMLTVAQTGSTTIANLTSALPVRSTSGGSLFNGAIALGGSDVSGTLPIARGGTNQTSFTAIDLLYFDGGSIASVPTVQYVAASAQLLLNNLSSSVPFQLLESSPTSTAVLGNLVQSGGVTAYATTTNLSATQFCGLGLAYINSTSTLGTTLKFPDLTQVAAGPCGSTVWSSGFAQQFVYDASTSSSFTVQSSGTSESLFYAPGSSATIAPGQTQNAIGQFVASSTIQGANTAGMSFNAYLQTFQPRPTAPTMQGQFLMASTTATGGNPEWVVGNLLATSPVTVATGTPGQITVACSTCLTGNQTITLSGAVTGSGATSIATVFGVGAFATGTSGTIFNIATTTTTLTINMPTASAVNTGQLSSTDWSTFNGKQAALSGGTAGFVTRWTSASALGVGKLIDDGTSIGINATSSTINFLIQGAAATTNTLFQVASSSTTSVFKISQTGTTTLAGVYPVASGTTATELTINPTLTVATASTASMIQISPTINSIASMTPMTALYMQQTIPTVTLSAPTTTINSYYQHYSQTTFTTGTITSLYQLYLDAPTVTGSSTITNAFGLIVAPSSSTTKYTVLNGIGSTTPTATLSLQGNSGQSQDLLRVASSTGLNYLSVTSAGQVLLDPTARLTIPQGTAPTLSAAGDIAQDTTNDQLLYGSQPNVLMATSTKTMTIVAPTASEDDDFFITDVPITIIKVQCNVRNSNTSSVTFSLPHSTNRSTASANLFSSGQACTATTTPQSFTTFSDNTLAAGEVMWATTSATTLASTTSITIFYKYDRQ